MVSAEKYLHECSVRDLIDILESAKTHPMPRHLFDKVKLEVFDRVLERL
jgi:hypothetical protein